MKSSSARLLPGLLFAVIAGCGGGGGDMPAESVAKRLQASSASDAAPPLPDAGLLFDWAEWKYPELFPNGPQNYPLSYLGVDYTVRSYPNGNNLGLTTAGAIFGLGPFTNNVLTPFGQRADYAAQVAADICAVRPGACVNGQPVTQGRIHFGSAHVVAVRGDGRVIAWGLDNVGQLGGGAPIAGSNARLVETTAVAVAAGLYESLALGSDGIVRGWGRKFGGTTIIGGDALNAGTSVPSPAVTAFPGGVTHLTTGTGNAFAFVRRSDGTVWHLPGQATAISGGFSQQARPVSGLPAVTSLGHGVSAEPLAIAQDGTVWRITVFAAGPGSWQAAAAPVQGLSGVSAAVCNGYSCLALLGDGTLRSFGGFASAPAPVAGVPPMARIATTGSQFIAASVDGEVWRWNTGAAPQQVPGLTQVVAIAGGLQTALVLRADGSVWGWGQNLFGELGAGMPSSPSEPVQVPGITLN